MIIGERAGTGGDDASRRPRRVVKTGTVVALGILTMVGLWATYRFTGERGRTSFTFSRERAMANAGGRPDSNRPETRTAPLARRAVAVLPFANPGRRPDAAWLSTALSELVSAELQSGGTLRVVPGDAVSRMAADLALPEAESYTKDTLDRIRAQLACDLVIGGSFLELGDTLRIDVRAQDAATGETLVVVSETGSRGDLPGVAARVAASLRQQMGLTAAAPADLVR